MPGPSEHPGVENKKVKGKVKKWDTCNSYAVAETAGDLTSLPSGRRF